MTDRLHKLEQMHAGDPADADLPYMIAIEHGNAERFDDAITWLDKTLALDAHYHYAYFQKAKMLSELGDDDDAVAVLDEGIAQAAAANDGKALGELQELRGMLAAG
ncbi:hypothetical protein OT109_06230 [Phycisphaeraceae bacterium D3-23]